MDVSPAVPLPGRHEVAVDVVVPAARTSSASPSAASVVLACLPGGFLSRRYFDLDPGGADGYSFAEAMAAQGFATLAFDHLGTGESTRPDPPEQGYALGVEAIAAIQQCALERALERLAQGDPDHGIPPIRASGTVGVGHSMGSALTVEHQAFARPHRALVLFSFTTRGVPRFLNEDQRRHAGDPVRARRELGPLAQRSFGTPYPERANDSGPDRRAAFGIGTAPPESEALLHGAATNLLGLAGLLSMIPGGYAPAALKIDVPVFILVGDHDLHDARGLREELPKAPSVVTRTLADCWHCHFVANGREATFRETADWIRTSLADETPQKENA
ncbi:MAG: alpha/beta fold hydrolase [Deltaproteobacteria bacterium]|nr:alpha/beta fold hydrolase [Deltaproteobacteria bacterium]